MDKLFVIDWEIPSEIPLINENDAATIADFRGMLSTVESAEGLVQIRLLINPSQRGIILNKACKDIPPDRVKQIREWTLQYPDLSKIPVVEPPPFDENQYFLKAGETVLINYSPSKKLAGSIAKVISYFGGGIYEIEPEKQPDQIKINEKHLSRIESKEKVVKSGTTEVRLRTQSKPVKKTPKADKLIPLSLSEPFAIDQMVRIAWSPDGLCTGKLGKIVFYHPRWKYYKISLIGEQHSIELTSSGFIPVG